MSDENLYEKLCRVTLNFTIWTGAVAVEDCDLRVGEGGKVPSRKVADRGRKDIVDTKVALGPMNAVKTQARRMLDRYGIKEDEAWVIPVDLADHVCSELDKLKDEFDLSVQELVATFDEKKQAWLSANPEDAEVIARGQAQFDAVNLATRFDAGYRATRFMPVREEDVANFNEDAKGIGVKLLVEISEQAQDMLNKYFLGKERVSVSTKKTLIKMRNRINGLRFLNRAFTPIVEMLDEIIKGYQVHASKGYLVGAFYFQVTATLLIMSDRAKLKDLVDNKLNPQILGKQLAADANPSEPQPASAPAPEQTATAPGAAPMPANVQTATVKPDVVSTSEVAPTYEVRAFQLGAQAPAAEPPVAEQQSEEVEEVVAEKPSTLDVEQTEEVAEEAPAKPAPETFAQTRQSVPAQRPSAGPSFL